MLYLPCAAPISLPCAVPISIRVTTIAMIPSRMNVIVNDQDVSDTLNLVMKTNFIDTKRSELKSRLCGQQILYSSSDFHLISIRRDKQEAYLCKRI